MGGEWAGDDPADSPRTLTASLELRHVAGQSLSWWLPHVRTNRIARWRNPVRPQQALTRSGVSG